MTTSRNFKYPKKEVPLYTPDTIISRCGLNYDTTLILVVEGEDDPIALSGIVDNKACNVVDLHGKSEVILCLKKAHDNKKENIVGLVDSDYDKILKGLITKLSSSITKNLFVTDSHDMNTIVAASNAFLKMLESNYPIRGKDTAVMKKIREFAVEITQQIGLVRCLSADGSYPKLKCNFKEDGQMYPPHIRRYIDVANHKANLEALLESVKNELTPKQRLELIQFILEEYSVKIQERYPKVDLPWQLCQGHDLFSVLYIFLQEDGFKGYSFKEFSEMLFTQFGIDELKDTGKNLHLRIMDWEKKAKKAGKSYHILQPSTLSN